MFLFFFISLYNYQNHNAMKKTVQDLLLHTPLYHKEKLDQSDHGKLFDLKFFRGTIDCYCSGCNAISTFKGSAEELEIKNYKIPNFSVFLNRYRTLYSIIDKELLNQIYFIETQCTRNNEHKAIFAFKITANTIEKIGQYPSPSAFARIQLEKYNVILSANQYEEFTRAVDLASQQVGIGAFVYLVRIFKNLIEACHKTVLKNENWDENLYFNGNMAEKIDLLKTELPKFIFEQKTVFDTLNRGVEELTEAECLKFFAILKVGIELMLDSQLEALERKRKEEEVSGVLKVLKGK